MADPDDILPDFHPQTVLRDWGEGQGFHLADALTGVCVFGATGSGKTSGPAKHLAYGYLANDFGGLVLCAKKEERRQWQQWAADCGREDDLIIVDSTGKWRFNFLEWEASRPEASGGLTINIVAILDEIAGATRTAFDAYVTVPPNVAGQDEAGRLWDVLWMLRFAIRKARPGQTRLPFALYVRNDNHRLRLVKLIATCGALDIDDPQPAITVMMPGED